MPPKGSKSKKGKQSQRAAQPPRASRAQPGAIAFASTSGIRSSFLITHSKRKGLDVLRVRMVDQLASGIPTPGAYASTSGPVSADAIPFTLASNSPYLAHLGQVLPKLQGLSRVFGRYQVLSARVHHQSLSAANTPVSLGLAVVPGFHNATGNLAELASYAHSAVMPAWQNGSTSLWSNAESRWFNTSDVDAESADPQVPFTVLRCYGSSGTADAQYTNPLEGLIWLELDIEFIDLQPAPQSSCVLSVGSAADSASVTGTTWSGTVVPWQRSQQMEGAWDWAPRIPRSVYQGATTTPLRPGSVVSTVGRQGLNIFTDLILGAATVEARASSTMPLLAWPGHARDDDWREAKSDQGFPHAWTCAERKRLICSFRSTNEAIAASRAGFDAIAAVRSVPEVAGDYTVYYFFQPDRPGASAVVLYSQTHSGGTGAISHAYDEVTIAVDEPGMIYVLVQPTASESRLIDGLSQIALNVLDYLLLS